MTQDMISGASAVIVGSGYLYLALQLRESALSDNVGPGGVPTIIGVATIVLGACLMLHALIRRTQPGETGAAPVELRRQIRRAAGLLAIGIGFLVVLPYLGYVPAVALLIGTVAAYQGVAPGLRLAAIGIGGAIGLWLLFAGLLGIKMPTGVIAQIL